MRVVASDGARLEKRLNADGVAHELRQDAYIIATPDSVSAFQILKKYEGEYTDFEFRHGNMDDVFLELTGATREKGE